MSALNRERLATRAAARRDAIVADRLRAVGATPPVPTVNRAQRRAVFFSLPGREMRRFRLARHWSRHPLMPRRDYLARQGRTTEG